MAFFSLSSASVLTFLLEGDALGFWNYKLQKNIKVVWPAENILCIKCYALFTLHSILILSIALYSLLSLISLHFWLSILWIVFIHCISCILYISFLHLVSVQSILGILFYYCSIHILCKLCSAFQYMHLYLCISFYAGLSILYPDM